MVVLHGAPPARAAAVARRAYLDNLKVLLVAGVIVAHAVFAWTTVGTWVLREPSIREPLLSAVELLALVGGLLGLAPFFVIAGELTPSSLERKGTRRFLADRTIRLGVPMVFFVVVLSPFVEYVDTDNAGWDRGFWAFTLEIWWPPAPGPTWFLGVLLLFSVVYVLARTIVARRPVRTILRARYLVAAGAMLVAASFVVRLFVPFAEERYRLALGQAPAWAIAFALGIVAGERGWFDPVPPAVARACQRVAAAAGCAVVTLVVIVTATGSDVEPFAGGGTWQSLVLAVLEAGLVIGLSVWLLDVFRRRYDHQGSIARGLSRAAYGAFLVHQLVLVGFVLATRLVAWPPEMEFLVATTLAVAGSFGLAALLVRIPGLSRIV
ncbi:MAG TPA: acyltransferase [Jiangellaceae bacterium]|nr:acyltransferase [Jiangellaceae bacterium]